MQPPLAERDYMINMNLQLKIVVTNNTCAQLGLKQ